MNIALLILPTFTLTSPSLIRHKLRLSPMPRLPPSLIWRARRISPHVATLLPVCRDIPSALTELRWIREHVESTPSHSRPAPIRLAQLCEQRGKGIPLQYVLGTQPFGNLEIKCRPGVLIPRPEPEAYTTHLAHLILSTPSLFPHLPPPSQPLQILDFCTGTGCIALLLYSHLTTPSSPFQHLSITGVDISPLAISLSELNLRHNISLSLIPPATPRKSISFIQSSIFSPDWVSTKAKCDILISNPPYISPRGFNTDVARSVRNYEPKLAQVPEPHHTHHSNLQEEDVRQEDIFYARLLDIGAAQRLSVMLFETGGMEQAKRVVEMAAEKLGMDDWKIEIWRDWPDGRPEVGEERVVLIEGLGEVEVKGSGHGRSVFISKR